MNKQTVKDLALKNGFKLKEQPSGELELNPYVYDFADELVKDKQQELESLKAQLEELEAELLKHQSDDYVLVKKDKIDVFWQDDDEPENFCSREEDLNVLAEACDVGDIMVINETHTAHIKTEKLFGVVVHGTDGLKLKVFDNYADAHKAMIEAQEQQ